MGLFDAYDLKMISIAFGLLAIPFALSKNLQGFVICFIIALFSFFYREIKIAPMVKDNLPVTSVEQAKARKKKVPKETKGGRD